MTVRDRLHDPHNIAIDRCLVFRRDCHRYSSLARVPVPRLNRASVATCRKNCLIGSAGEPQTSSYAFRMMGLGDSILRRF